MTAPPFRKPPPEMQKLCEAHEGLKIYRTALNVAGFVDATAEGCGGGGFCSWALGNSKYPGRYRFVETKATAKQFQTRIGNYTSSREGMLVDRVKLPGLYRFTKEKIGHPNCRIFEEWQALANKTKRFVRLLGWERHCIATWPIKRFSARYEIRKSKIGRTRPYGRLLTLINTVVDRQDNSLMAEYRINFINFAKHDGGVHCKNRAKDFEYERVLLPVPKS